ncbi:hypothetical protein CYMTET_17298 [Cymbomonas tetramitiformis]|uniref:Uncharacterized protein n=1 Tax=Cymbomonas tetramitiformis TaxID=36881 RepID=A0AAE0GAE3_9CHLO|nr:hypothetical protein CYMTET_17298 [Cymbomonas tetramitiformis]
MRCGASCVPSRHALGVGGRPRDGAAMSAELTSDVVRRYCDDQAVCASARPLHLAELGVDAAEAQLQEAAMVAGTSPCWGGMMPAQGNDWAQLTLGALFDMTGTYTISFTIAAGACIAASLSAFLLQDSDVILESLKEAEQND